MSPSRFEQLNDALRSSDLDAVILNPGPTLTHLTGLRFHLMERPVVLMFARDQDPAIVLPELELQKVASLPSTGCRSAVSSLRSATGGHFGIHYRLSKVYCNYLNGSHMHYCLFGFRLLIFIMHGK